MTEETREKPQLSKVSVDFYQEGNTMGTAGDIEVLKIDLEFQAGEEDGPFIVLKTDTGWSIDDISDITLLIDRVKKVLEK